MVWSDPMFAIITFPNPHTNHVSSVYLTHPEQVLVTARFAFASELRRRPVTATHARRRRQQRPGGGPIARAACLVVPLHARRADPFPFPLINSRPTPASEAGGDPDPRRPPRLESAHHRAGEKAMAPRNSWREGSRAVKINFGRGWATGGSVGAKRRRPAPFLSTPPAGSFVRYFSGNPVMTCAGTTTTTRRNSLSAARLDDGQ